MKTKHEIKEMIVKCKRLRGGMPQFSMFGDDNWKKIDQQIEALNKCLGLSESEIGIKQDVRIDAMEELCKDWDDDGMIHVYDWVLGKCEDEPVTDEDLEIFCKE